MTHDDRLLAFLAGDIDSCAAEAFDEHLLDCDRCWTAVHEDHLGRLAAEAAREIAPVELRDRIRFAVTALAPPVPPPRGGHRSGRGVLLLVGAVAVVMSALVLAVASRSSKPPPAADPPVIASVVQLAAGDTQVTVDGLTVDGAAVTVSRRAVAGQVVVVATASRPFPMPRGASPVAAGPDAPWAAERGDVHVLCISTPRPALLAGPVPVADLRAVAADLGLL